MSNKKNKIPVGYVRCDDGKLKRKRIVIKSDHYMSVIGTLNYYGKKYHECCWEVDCVRCGKICGKKECPYDMGYDSGEDFICDDHSDSD